MARRIQAGDDRGAVAVLVAIAMSALLIPLLAIVVDLGFARELRDQAQLAADSAALAAAVAVHEQGLAQADARAIALQYVQRNYGTDLTAFQNCLSSCVSFGPQSVTVSLPRVSSPQFFATGTPAVAASATASWASYVGCGLCVSGNLTVGYQSNPGLVSVTGGDVYIGRDVDAGSNAGGTIVVSGGYVQYTPGAFWDGRVTVQPANARVQVNSVTQPDVSAATSSLEALATSGLPQVFPQNGNCAPPSGSLAGFIPAPSLHLCNGQFAPGVYVVTGSSNGGEARITGDSAPALAGQTSGALFYFTCGDSSDRPVVCGQSGVSYEPLLRSSNCNCVVAGLAGVTDPSYTDLNGYSIVVDPAIGNQQTLGGSSSTGLTISSGDVSIPNVSVSRVTLGSGRLIAGTVSTSSRSTPPPSLSITYAGSPTPAPIRLVS